MVNFGSTAGYLWLDSWVLANIIYLGTESFCERFLNYHIDPKGRLYDQMVMAARSAPANIAEGASRHQTSTRTEMELTDVARATISELSNDYMNWLLRNQQFCWSRHDARWQALHSIRLDRPSYSDDLMLDVSKHIINQKAKFNEWIEHEDSFVCANAMLILCGRLIRILQRQMQRLLEEFKENGGFAENLTKERTAAMQQQAAKEQAPLCPDCGKPMRKRKQTIGLQAGKDFWGCCDFPHCRGTREMDGSVRRKW